MSGKTVRHKLKLKNIPASPFILYSFLGWTMAALLGSLTSILLLRIPGFPNLAAAQLTAGVIGLVGGLSWAFLIRKIGGALSWKRGLFLALAWAVSCVLGITPLFFTSSLASIMLVLTFYSFATGGILGGFATVRAMNSALPRSANDILTPVAICSFGLGVAAITPTIVGERLSLTLPAWKAWAIGFEAMAMIVAAAGGYALLRLSRAARSGKDAHHDGGDTTGQPGTSTLTSANVLDSRRSLSPWVQERRLDSRLRGNDIGGRGNDKRGGGNDILGRGDATRVERGNDGLGRRGARRAGGGNEGLGRGDALRARGGDDRIKLDFIVLIILCLPFYLNDLSDIYVRDWRLWLTIDYLAVKLFPLLVVSWLFLRKKMTFADFGLTAQPIISLVSIFYVCALLGSVIEQTGYLILGDISAAAKLGEMPDIPHPFWHGLDLTVGLLLTGICEELVFRGYLRAFLVRYTQSAALIIGASALAFGFIHWSGGYEKVLVTALVGAFFMLLYLRTRSLPAIMLAHFAIDFLDFSHLLPKFIFL